MRVLIAPDKFAGTLTAVEAADAIADGWRRSAPDDDVTTAPLSDGGPGFVDVVQAALGGNLLSVTATGPRGEQVPTTLLLVEGTAYVEAAQACGLHLVPPTSATRSRRRRTAWDSSSARLWTRAPRGSSSDSAAAQLTTAAPACSRPWAQSRLPNCGWGRRTRRRGGGRPRTGPKAGRRRRAHRGQRRRQPAAGAAWCEQRLRCPKGSIARRRAAPGCGAHRLRRADRPPVGRQ